MDLKKAVVTGLAITVISFTSFAQRGGCVQAEKNTKLFILKTKAMVMLTKNQAYNDAITKAFKENWKVTPYDFVPISDLKKYLSSYAHSVVLPVNDNSTTTIAVLRGDRQKKDISNFTKETMIAYADLDGLAFEPSMNDAIYRLPHMVKSMDNYISEVNKGKIDVSDCTLIRSNTARYYNRNASGLKGKTLLIDNRYEIKGDLEALYPFSCKLVDKKEIEEAVRNRKAGVCYLVSNYIFDAQTGQVLHMSYESLPSKKLGKGFFKELVSNIEGR